MGITITELDKKELECADLLFQLIDKMDKLGPDKRKKVYARWSQLHLLLPDDVKRFEANVLRTCDRSGRDRRHG